jgi:hypothetical protein
MPVLQDIKLKPEAKKNLLESEKMFEHLGRMLQKAKLAGINVEDRIKRTKELEKTVVGVLREFG